ncbi:MAG TPA: PilX N-terminal domain-containing pilus assembly protein [Steroidobacteraceae bacterium]|nr:PilX N-terminal domain-containing pilus assembly protein [Steroidobacteraceae bacterium]
MRRIDLSARLRSSHQRGMVLFMSLILLLVLTVLGIALARQQTVEERLAQNDYNHQLALQTAQAALEAAFDDVGGPLAQANYLDNSTPGLATLGQELGSAPYTTLDRTATWTAPGTNTMVYTNNGAPLSSAPAAARPQFVVEDLPPIPPPKCGGSNAGNYGSTGNRLKIRRITAHAAGGDGTASATVQLVRIQGC